MGSDLVEALAVRLRQVGEGADATDDFKWNCAGALPALAREVLRQMRWARHDTLREFVSDDAREIRPLEQRHNLTLASEDWT